MFVSFFKLQLHGFHTILVWLPPLFSAYLLDFGDLLLKTGLCHDNKSTSQLMKIFPMHNKIFDYSFMCGNENILNVNIQM